MRWTYTPFPAEEVEELCRTAGVSAVLAELLLRAGLKEPEVAARFLRPALAERDRRVRISRRLAVVAGASTLAAAGLEAAVWSTRDAEGERTTLSTPVAITMHGAALAAGGLAIGSGGAALMVRW